jgi:arginyl-tRNA synthetase
VRHLLDFPDALASPRSAARPTRSALRLRAGIRLLRSSTADCKVLGDDAELSAARLALVDATRSVLSNALELLGISAPDSM